VATLEVMGKFFIDYKRKDRDNEAGSCKENGAIHDEKRYVKILNSENTKHVFWIQRN
jgi:hypothetical protein